MKNRIQSLRDKAMRALSEYRALEHTYSQEHSQMLTDAEKKIDLFLAAKYDGQMKQVGRTANDAQDALDTEIERVSLSGEGAPYPIGTRLLRDVQRRSWDPIQTIYGIVSVITRTSEHPDNVTSWKHAHVGQFVVRILKADGTPSKRYETSFREWVPEDKTVKRNEAFFAPKDIKL